MTWLYTILRGILALLGQLVDGLASGRKDDPTPEPQPEPTPEPQPEPTPTPRAARPFVVYNVPEGTAPFTGMVVPLSGVTEALMARLLARGWKVVLSYGGNEKFLDPATKVYDPKLYASYITSQGQKIGALVAKYLGTVVMGAIVADDIHDTTDNSWGRSLTDAEVDTMAGVYKAAFPGITTWVRITPDKIGKSWKYLDGAMSNYTLAQGDFLAWLMKVQAAYAATDLRRAWGLNTHNGGANGGAMSAEQIEQWGLALATLEGEMLMSWRWFDTEMDPARVAAFTKVAAALAV